MEKELDKYCTEIITVLIMTRNEESLRFNKLYEQTKKFGAKMAKPTFIQHLNHLIKKKLIIRKKEGKQKVTLKFNWEKFAQLLEVKKNYEDMTAQLIKNKPLVNVNDVLKLVTETLLLGDLYKLKFSILSLTEPENKFNHNINLYYIINHFTNIPLENVMKICLESKEKAKLTINAVDESIKIFQQALTNVLANKPPDYSI
jgi:hypothetical protein